jgi:hypothetical protein
LIPCVTVITGCDVFAAFTVKNDEFAIDAPFTVALVNPLYVNPLGRYSRITIGIAFAAVPVFETSSVYVTVPGGDTVPGVTDFDFDSTGR